MSGAEADQAPQSPIVGDLREMPLLMVVGGAEELLDEVHPTGRVLLDRVGDWVSQRK